MAPLPASGFWKHLTKLWHLYLHPHWKLQGKGKSHVWTYLPSAVQRDSGGGFLSSPRGNPAIPKTTEITYLRKFSRSWINKTSWQIARCGSWCNCYPWGCVWRWRRRMGFAEGWPQVLQFTFLAELVSCRLREWASPCFSLGKLIFVKFSPVRRSQKWVPQGRKFVY